MITDGNFGRNIACREGKSDPEYLFQYEQNTDPFMLEVVINLPPGSWMITPRKCCYPGDLLLVSAASGLNIQQWP